MKKEFVRNPYNYDSDQLSNDTGLECKDESLTQQQFLTECDINHIADVYMKTGLAPQVLQLPTQGDFEGIFDFQGAMNTIKTAKDQFMLLPAKIRTRFNNDPAELIAFVQDDDNLNEALKLGFIDKEKYEARIARTPPNDQTGGPGARGTQSSTPANEGTQKPGPQAPQNGGG